MRACALRLLTAIWTLRMTTFTVAMQHLCEMLMIQSCQFYCMVGKIVFEGKCPSCWGGGFPWIRKVSPGDSPFALSKTDCPRFCLGCSFADLPLATRYLHTLYMRCIHALSTCTAYAGREHMDASPVPSLRIHVSRTLPHYH